MWFTDIFMKINGVERSPWRYFNTAITKPDVLSSYERNQTQNWMHLVMRITRHRWGPVIWNTTTETFNDLILCLPPALFASPLPPPRSPTPFSILTLSTTSFPPLSPPTFPYPHSTLSQVVKVVQLPQLVVVQWTVTGLKACSCANTSWSPHRGRRRTEAGTKSSAPSSDPEWPSIRWQKKILGIEFRLQFVPEQPKARCKYWVIRSHRLLIRLLAPLTHSLARTLCPHLFAGSLIYSVLRSWRSEWWMLGNRAVLDHSGIVFPKYQVKLLSLWHLHN